MSTTRTQVSLEGTLFAALELGKKSWLLALQMIDMEQPSLHQLKGGDAAALIARLERAREQHAKRAGHELKIVVCCEAGYDGFWLWRVLQDHGVTCHIVDAASLEVSRRRRRPKTDRIDAAKLVRALIAWYRGEREVCSMVRVPTREDEDLRRSHRERSRLIGEQTAHINRIKGLLFAYGIRDLKRRCDRLVLDDLKTGDGRPFTARQLADLCGRTTVALPGPAGDRVQGSGLALYDDLLRMAPGELLVFMRGSEPPLPGVPNPFKGNAPPYFEPGSRFNEGLDPRPIGVE
jgi:transposase